MLNTSETIYWLALSRIPGIGPVSLRKKWNEYGDIQKAWDEIAVLHPESDSYLDAAQLELKKAHNFGASILTLDSPAFPQVLSQIPDISPILYVMGELQSEDEQAAGIVGTRHPSRYGAEVTQKLTRQFCELGYTIVSGMAKGIDAVAHQTAIESGGRTLAIWGSGLDCVYPPEHKQLTEQILKHGAIISPYPFGTQAQSFTFPERNKIIAGLSQVIVVTEAKAESGSLLTAEAGFKYGKRVGAVPGSMYYIGSAGPHQLIKKGARLVVDAADIVDTMIAAKIQRHQNHPPVTSLTVLEQAILDRLQLEPQHADELIRSLAQPAANVVGTLAILEIKGLVKQLAPGEYLKCV